VQSKQHGYAWERVKIIKNLGKLINFSVLRHLQNPITKVDFVWRDYF